MVHDVVVIGAGFAGLSAALHLAEAGKSVVVCESLKYPGGCASTFRKGDAEFESGATMFAGFGPGQWMSQLVERHQLDVHVDLLDPVVEFRTRSEQFVLSAERQAFVDQLKALPGAPAAKLDAFFTDLVDVADPLWRVFEAPELLPPLSARSVVTHAMRAPAYLPVLRWVGRPLSALVHHHGLETFRPLVTWLDAVCQITVQASSQQAEAPAALAAVDYFFRGTAHIRGGIGSLAREMCRAIEGLGGSVQMPNAVKAVRRDGDHWLVTTRRGVLRARQVIGNVLPHDLERLLGEDTHADRLKAAVEGSWGAAMLYLRVRNEGLPQRPWHLQCVGDDGEPLVEGNHVLVSVSEPDGSDLRSVTVSTHMNLVSSTDMAEHVARVQARMRSTLARRMPELDVVLEYPASPRTFRRFTGRHRGFVGGVPRLAGLSNYRQLWPVQARPGLWLTGDSTFPGQSVLAVSLGGHRVATSVLRAS